jgi:hypothetical protein
MSTTNASQSLGEKIEKVILEHMSQLRQEAAQAMERVLSARAATEKRSPAGSKRARSNGQRRGAMELNAMAEEFYAAVCDNPGANMTILAAKLGRSAMQLHRPVARLKQAGRVRSVGERQHTCYFPGVGERGRQ